MTAANTDGSGRQGGAVQGAAKPEWAMSAQELARLSDAAAGKRRARWPWVLLLLGLIGVGGYYYQSVAPFGAPQGASQEPPRERILQINPDEYVTIAPQRLQRSVKVIGPLAPSRRAQLSSQTGGRVEEVTVRPGETVRTGDILVQINVEKLTLDLDLQRSNAGATRAQLALAEAQLERVEALMERGVASVSSLDQARSAVEGYRSTLSALADQVAAAELALRNATLRAPFDGIVSARAVEPGQFVSIGTPLVSIVDLSRVEMQGSAAVATGSLLRPGQDVLVSVDGISGREFAGRVERINPVAMEGTRTIQVYIQIDNPDGLLLGGMFATGQIVVEQLDAAFAVPIDALREDREGAYVLKIVDDMLQRQSVTVAGLWEGRLHEISAGLSSGDSVVSAPLNILRAGDKVVLVGN
jgi:membrane fusion protein (multidrug efflux system)